MDLFMRYLFGEDEVGKQIFSEDIGNIRKLKGKRDDVFRKFLMNKDDIVKKVELFVGKVEKILKLKEVFYFNVGLYIYFFLWNNIDFFQLVQVLYLDYL